MRWLVREPRPPPSPPGDLWTIFFCLLVECGYRNVNMCVAFVPESVPPPEWDRAPLGRLFGRSCLSACGHTSGHKRTQWISCDFHHINLVFRTPQQYFEQRVSVTVDLVKMVHLHKYMLLYGITTKKVYLRSCTLGQGACSQRLYGWWWATVKKIGKGLNG